MRGAGVPEAGAGADIPEGVCTEGGSLSTRWNGTPCY